MKTNTFNKSNLFSLAVLSINLLFIKISDMQKQIIFIVFLITAFSFNSNAERKLPIIVKLTSGEVLKGHLIEIKDSSIVLLKNKSNDNKEIQVNYRQIKKINFKRDYIGNTTQASLLIGFILYGTRGLVLGDSDGNSASINILFLGVIGGGVGAISGFFIGNLITLLKTTRIKINSNFDSFVQSKEFLEKNIFKLDANKKIIFN